MNWRASEPEGVEAELGLRPVDGLSLQGNVTYIDARLMEDQNTGAVATSGLKGDRIPFVPKWMGGASAQYDWALNETLSGMARVDLSYVGGSWSDFRHDYVYAREVKDYALFNARIGIEGFAGAVRAHSTMAPSMLTLTTPSATARAIRRCALTPVTPSRFATAAWVMPPA